MEDPITLDPGVRRPLEQKCKPDPEETGEDSDDTGFSENEEGFQ